MYSITVQCHRILNTVFFSKKHNMYEFQDPVPIWDMPFAIPIFMKDAHSAESNEKSIFRFLFFELWLILFTV